MCRIKPLFLTLKTLNKLLPGSGQNPADHFIVGFHEALQEQAGSARGVSAQVHHQQLEDGVQQVVPQRQIVRSHRFQGPKSGLIL